ncbi:hypothetical protein EBZ38_10695 [bacterium]|nr:hypothetical protein [bacterium]
MKWPDNQIGVSGHFYLRSALDFDDDGDMIRKRRQTMNPQPSETVGQVWALIFVFGIAVFAIKAFFEADVHKQSLDLFTLGYIEDNHTSIINNTTTTNFYESSNDNKITKLQLDCIDTLIAIGYKKRVARKMVMDYFKNNTATSVQEFISDILKK